MAEKRIEVVKMKVKDLKDEFGNPRKITAKKKEELKESLDRFGDFGIIVIDEHNNIISGNQRVSVLMAEDPNTEVTCKRLIGYSRTELRAINVKANTHAGEWDLDALAEWTADMNLDLGVEMNNGKKVEERSIDEMELIHYEKYDYVLIACRDELSYNSLVRSLGIENKKTLIGPKKRPIKGRAIWFDDMKVNFVPKTAEDIANNGGKPQIVDPESGEMTPIDEEEGE